MSELTLQQMKMRLQPIADSIKAKVGDAFNLDTLARLFAQVETINGISPQLQQVIEYAKFIPVNNSINAVVGTAHTLNRKQGVGKGKPFSGTGMDIPLAEVIYDQVTLPTKAGAVGYQFSLMEVATALAMGMSLEADKVASANLAFERHMSDVAWFGEEKTGVKGFYNQTGVSLTTKNINLATASVSEVLNFINTLLYEAIDATEYDSAINTTTLLLPTNLMRTLSSRTVSSTNETPLLQYIKANNEATLEGRNIEITSNKRGNGIGTAQSDRIVAYCKDPNCIEMRIPQELRFEPAQPKGLDIFVAGSYLYQGVWLKRVDSMRYYDVSK